MVRTRSKSKLDASAVREGSPACNSSPSSSTEIRVTETEEEKTTNLEELALQALSVIKRRQGQPRRVAEHRRNDEDSTTQPEVLLLESEAPRERVSKTKASSSLRLSSTLQPRLKEKLYFSFNKKDILASSSATGKSKSSSWETGDEHLLAKSIITPDFEKKERAPPLVISKYARAKARKVCSSRLCVGLFFFLRGERGAYSKCSEVNGM